MVHGLLSFLPRGLIKVSCNRSRTVSTSGGGWFVLHFFDHENSTVFLRSFDLHFCQLSGFRKVQETQTAKRTVTCFTSLYSRVSDQNGVSLLYIMLEIHHSERAPSIIMQYMYICCCCHVEYDTDTVRKRRPRQ